MVRLIAKTQSLIEARNAEEFSVYVARITSEREDKISDYEKLVAYLIKNKHWSPFEHFYYTFEIETTRAIGRQLLRHRSFTFQEYSQRYGTDIEIELPEMRKKAKNNRQGSTEEIVKYTDMVSHLGGIKFIYNRLIADGIAPECARMILPECTRTTLCMTGNIRSWVHFLEIRNHSHAQKEIRRLAQEIQDILEKEIPLIFKQLGNEKESIG